MDFLKSLFPTDPWIATSRKNKTETGMKNSTYSILATHFHRLQTQEQRNKSDVSRYWNTLHKTSSGNKLKLAKRMIIVNISFIIRFQLVCLMLQHPISIGTLCYRIHLLFKYQCDKFLLESVICVVHSSLGNISYQKEKI